MVVNALDQHGPCFFLHRGQRIKRAVFKCPACFAVLYQSAFDVFIGCHLGDGVEIAQWFEIRKYLTKQKWLDVPMLGHELFHGEVCDVGEGFDHLKGALFG